MTLDDAIVGQYALACCDAISAFVRDQVLGHADDETLLQLLREVCGSLEFQRVDVQVEYVPGSAEGRKLRW